MLRADKTRGRASVFLIDQPTILRENKSITMAR